jgi:CHASE3 domain sensor protein
MKRLKRKSRLINFVFGIGLILTIFVDYIAVQGINRLNNISGWVVHTTNVLSEVRNFLSIVRDVEGSARQYVIKYDKKRISSLQESVDQVRIKMDELKKLTLDNPAQQERLLKLRSVTENRIEQMKKLVSIQQAQGFKASSQFFFSNESEGSGNEIRSVITDIESEEYRLLRERLGNAAVQRGRIIKIIFSGGIFSFIFLILAILLLNKTLINQKKAEEKTKEQQHLLESIINCLGEGVVVADINGKTWHT